MWSVGCILAELIIRKPLLPAASEEEQLNMITKLLGNPSSKLVNQIENEKNREFVLQLNKREPKDFNQVFKGARTIESVANVRTRTSACTFHGLWMAYPEGTNTPSENTNDASPS